MAKEKKEATPKSSDPVLAAIAKFDKEFGEGTVQLGRGTYVDVKSISTGILSVDVISGCGGLPRGRIIEIFGNESSGKTTFTLKCIASCQKSGGRAAFVDAEHALDPDWATRNGVNMDELLLTQPDNGEQALSIVEAMVKSGVIDMIVTDSVAALVPKVELEGDMDDQQVGAQARMMSKAMRKLVAATSKSNAVVVFINQLREKIGGWSPNGVAESTPGGRALKFYSSMRLEVKRKVALKGKGDKPIGNTAGIKIVKNKVAPPFRSTDFNIYFGTQFQEPVPLYGIDDALALIDGGVEVGAITLKGANYYFNDQKFATGKDNAISEVRSDEELFNNIYKASLTMIKPELTAVDKHINISDIEVPAGMRDDDESSN